MRRIPLFSSGAALLALTTLTGCDLLAVGQLMPGLLPGVGQPMTGTVIDAQTRLPVGGATVNSGLGTTVTDASGQFKLYGNLHSRELSVSRAGYTAVTMGGETWSRHQPIEIPITQQFPNFGALPKRFLELAGSVKGAPATTPGVVALGEQVSDLSNGAYSVQYGAEVPGKVMSSVLAWGLINGSYRENTAAPFYFTHFNYMISSWPLAESLATARVPMPLTLGPSAPFRQVAVKYSNAGSFASVRTDILLDFGVAGAVHVARATASNQTISVPDVPGLKYVVQGVARDTSGRVASTVSITTNDPGKAAFQLLSAPRVIGPASGATQAGQRPTFSWTPAGVDGVVYELTLFEGEKTADVPDGRPKWVARTTDTEVSYPAFSLGDLNAGALRADKKYTWTIRAIDLLDATEEPTRMRGPSVMPYRVRKREAETVGNTFTL